MAFPQGWQADWKMLGEIAHGRGKNMNCRICIVLVVLMFGMVSGLSGQDWQNRVGVHIQADVAKRLFVPVWSITNLRSETPNNTNIFAGIGVRGKDWWLEGMIQHQWRAAQNQWMLDFRFDKQASRWHWYAEASPFLTRKAFYEFVIVERRIWKGIAIGAETENLHQAGRDTVQIGLRASRKLGRFLGFDFSLAGTVRFSPVGGHTEPRLYDVFNRRFALADRK